MTKALQQPETIPVNRRAALKSGLALAVTGAGATLGFSMPTMAKAEGDDSAILAMVPKMERAKADEGAACDAYSAAEEAAHDDAGPMPRHPHYHYNEETMRWEYLTPEAPATWNEAVKELIAQYEDEAGPEAKAEVEEYEKAYAVYKRARKVAKRKHKVKAAERRSARATDYTWNLHHQVLAMPAATFAGLLVKARILGEWTLVTHGDDSDDIESVAVRAMLADLERLAGVA